MPKYQVNACDKTAHLDGSKSALRSNTAQILAVCIKNTLLLSFGMTLGFPTILIPGLQQQDSEDSFDLNQEDISWIGSINLICVPVGCALSGALTEYFGRKRCMQILNIPFLSAWLMFKFASSVHLIIIALCLTGLSGGMLEAPVITYVAEICHPRLRGILSSTSTLSVMAGILLQFLLGTFFHWRTVAITNCIFPIISFTLLFFVPESPHWLILKNRLLDARKSIAWLRGWTTLEEIEPEFKELCRYIASGGNNEKLDQGTNDTKLKSTPILDKIKLYTKKNFLWPYAVVSFCFFLHHFSGANTLQTYAVQIFASLQAPIDKYVATVYLGVAEVVGCAFCMFMIRKLGKRKLNFISLINVGICFVLVGTYAYLIDVTQLANFQQQTNSTSESVNDDQEGTKYSWVPLTLLILSAFFSHMGIRILPWILTGELYSNETRAAASGLSAAMGYIFGFLSNKTFLTLTDHLTLPGMFWMNSAIAFIGCALLYVFLPETEGKPLQEITDHFRDIKRLTNSVRRKNAKPNSAQNGKVNEAYGLDNLQKTNTDVVNHI